MLPLDVPTNRSPGRVVVALDGSPSSLRALREGARVAAALGLLLEAVTVWHQPDVYDGYLGGPLDPDVPAMQARAVDSVFGASPPPGFASRLVEGPTIATLLAESAGAEMLVLGSRGRGGFAGLLLGSVSAACAAHAACTVLVCHPAPAASALTADSGALEQGASDGADDRPLDRRIQPRPDRRPGSFDGPAAPDLPGPVTAPPMLDRDRGEVVVGVDGTPASIGALRQGAHFAESMRVPLLAVCAWSGATSRSREARGVLRAASRKVFGDERPTWFHASEREGTPEAVLGQASEHARMLIIGHGAPSAPASLRDSVSAAISLHARCPIVIFHSGAPVGAELVDRSSA